MAVTVERDGSVATVTLDCPPVNALTAETMRELTRAFTEAGLSRAVRVIVLRSVGLRAFCAGADFKDSERRYTLRTAASTDNAIDVTDPGSAALACFTSIYKCAVPVIAVVQGPALGAGIGLAACADFIVASERATFGLPEINVGVLGGSRFLHRLVGIPKTRSAALTGRPIPASEMYRLGAVESVVSPDELSAAVAELAAELATKSPIALRLGKRALNESEGLPVLEGYALEQHYTARLATFNDSAEARHAYQEKRQPQWTWS